MSQSGLPFCLLIIAADMARLIIRIPIQLHLHKQTDVGHLNADSSLTSQYAYELQ